MPLDFARGSISAIGRLEHAPPGPGAIVEYLIAPAADAEKPGEVHDDVCFLDGRDAISSGGEPQLSAGQPHVIFRANQGRVISDQVTVSFVLG